jgi:C4-dicarboxylate transporter DctQ subunit
MRLITSIDRALAKVEEVLLALLLIGLVLLAATQVLLRNIWATSIDWADLTLQNATVFLGLLGAAVATSEGRHLNIDLFGRRFKGRARFAVATLISIFGVAICTMLTRGGYQTFEANYAPWAQNLPQGWSAMKMLQQELSEGTFPQWLSQLMLPIGFGLMGIHFALRAVRDLSSMLSGKDWQAAEDQKLEGDAYLDQMLAYAEQQEQKQAGDSREIIKGEIVTKGDAEDYEPEECDTSAATSVVVRSGLVPKEATLSAELGGDTVVDDENDTLSDSAGKEDDSAKKASAQSFCEAEEAATELAPPKDSSRSQDSDDKDDDRNDDAEAEEAATVKLGRDSDKEKGGSK